MHLISAGGMHGKGFRGHADIIVFSMHRRVEIMAVNYILMHVTKSWILAAMTVQAMDIALNKLRYSCSVMMEGEVELRER